MKATPLQHVAVVGAGIIGLTTARALLERGHRVTLIDASARPAQGASARNGAQLSYAYVAPLASHTLWAQLPRLLFATDSPVRLGLRGVLADPAWCASFLAACNRTALERTTVALLELAALSRREWDRWLPHAGDVSHRRAGKLVVFDSAASLAQAVDQMQLQARLGCRQRAVTPGECRTLEPALATSTDIVGGIYTETEEVVDSAAVCAVLFEQLGRHTAFRAVFGQRVAAAVRQGRRVTALQLRDVDPAHGGGSVPIDALVVAAGAASAALARRLGTLLPVAPLKGYSIELSALRLRRMPRMSVTDSARRVVFAPLGEGERARLRVAGVAELVGHDLRIDPRRIAQLVEAASERFGMSDAPDLRGDALGELQPWAGLRPCTPSGLPCIGRFGGLSNVYANTGQGALGLTLAFGSAALLADALEGCPASINPLPFASRPLALIHAA